MPARTGPATRATGIWWLHRVLLFLFLYRVFVFILELLVRGRRTERVKDGHVVGRASPA
jgi:hypothetical protein